MIMSDHKKIARAVYVSAEELAKVKQDARDRDAEDLALGKKSKKDLIAKNDMFANVDFKKIRIIAIGDRKYEDID